MTSERTSPFISLCYMVKSCSRTSEYVDLEWRLLCGHFPCYIDKNTIRVTLLFPAKCIYSCILVVQYIHVLFTRQIWQMMFWQSKCLWEELNLPWRHHSRPPCLLWQQDGWEKNSGQFNFLLEIILVYLVLEECTPVTKAHNVSAGLQREGKTL